ncbi:MAG: sigma 54-interacting transcriptional regulator [Acidobacteriota bacterium]
MNRAGDPPRARLGNVPEGRGLAMGGEGSVGPSHFRLRGWIDGSERTFVLEEGVTSCGSAESNDIALSVPGVSRHHARLEQRDGQLWLEDLDSRNGSRLNGRRVIDGGVQVGDVLRLGPVELEVEQVAAGDAELALILAPAPPAPAATPDKTTANLGAPALSPKTEVPALDYPPDYVVGQAPAMVRFYREVQTLADSDLPVLVEGETGVGKESVARTLHRSSGRCDGPFVAVNCAAIPEELLEAEMFGIADGVATGVRRRVGTFRTASGGSLMLDEVGEMPLSLQAKLLRVLQESEVQPVGGQPVAVDVRVIAASNARLKQCVDAGQFRQDLYYRIAGGVLRVPPLRQRAEDIPRFVEHFLRRAAAGKAIRGMTIKALSLLNTHPWPGNVRELEHEVRRLAHLCPAGQAIDSTMLAAELGGEVAQADPGDAPGEASPVDAANSLADGGDSSWRLADQVQAAERRAIRRALEQTGGSQRQAAALLEISRNTLARKLRALDIAVGDRGATFRRSD